MSGRNPFAKGEPVMRDCVTTPPADVPAGAVWCARGCGDWWLTDPRLMVACPSCHAPVGSPCKRPSEHTVWRAGQQTFHATRRALAWERYPCSCDRLWLEAQQETVTPAPLQPDLFGGAA